jgi:hypothetical protein
LRDGNAGIARVASAYISSRRIDALAVSQGEKRQIDLTFRRRRDGARVAIVDESSGAVKDPSAQATCRAAEAANLSPNFMRANKLNPTAIMNCDSRARR